MRLPSLTLRILNSSFICLVAGSALSKRFIQHKRSGDADVKRFDRLLHWDGDALIDVPDDIGRQSRSLAAHNERGWYSEIGLEQWLAIAWHEGADCDLR